MRIPPEAGRLEWLVVVVWLGPLIWESVGPRFLTADLDILKTLM